MTLPELDWSRKPVVSDVIPPHPAPEVSARDALPEEIPTGARRMIKAAEAAGWEARPTYARGNKMNQYGRAGALIHSLAVRMRLPGTRHRAAAVWTSPALSEGAAKWTADGAYVWATGGLVTPVGIKEVTDHLKNPERLTYTSTDC